jgi:hypothetical protein
MMNKIFVGFILAVLTYILANAWGDVWGGQTLMQVVTAFVVVCDFWFCWYCLGESIEDDKQH